MPQVAENILNYLSRSGSEVTLSSEQRSQEIWVRKRNMMIKLLRQQRQTISTNIKKPVLIVMPEPTNLEEMLLSPLSSEECMEVFELLRE